MRYTWLQRVLGLIRCGVWGGTLWCVHAPWRELGGLVGERTRWAERWVLGMALLVGMALGNQARLWSAPGRGVDHAWFVRRLHLPLAGVLAIVLLLLQALGRSELLLICLNGWLAFCGGFDFEIAARPLVSGHDYRFWGPVVEPEVHASGGPEEPQEREEEDPVGWYSG